MAELIQIKQIQQLVNKMYNYNLEVIEYTTKPLTAAGENYGSLMLQVEIKTKSDSDGGETEKNLHLVAKMCPKNEWVRKMFNIAVSFKKEAAVYQTIVPILKFVQLERRVSNIIDCTPECYGARISLNPFAKEVDDDAIILMENLKLNGYQMMDRMEGFDLESVRLLIKELAVFHAVPIAVKLTKPGVFKKHFMPHLNTYSVFSNFSEEVQNEIVDKIVNSASLNPKCTPLLSKLKSALLKSIQLTINPPQPKEPFATIVHNDLWTNNAMVKMEAGKPVKCKIVDFQLIEYKSPADDIVFLLFTSLKKKILDSNYDDLIKLYYKEFIKGLRELGCDTAKFTYETLRDEIDTSARSFQLLHILIMMTPIFMKKDHAKSIEELTEEGITDTSALSKGYNEKVQEVVLEFGKRGWL